MVSFVEVGPGVLENMKLWTSYRQIDGRRANIIANLSIQFRWVKKVFDFKLTFIIYVYQIQFPYPLPFQNQLDPRMLFYLLNRFLFVRNRSFSLKLKLHGIGLMVPSIMWQTNASAWYYVCFNWFFRTNMSKIYFNNAPLNPKGLSLPSLSFSWGPCFTLNLSLPLSQSLSGMLIVFAPGQSLVDKDVS